MQRGETFELEVRELLQKELDSGYLGIARNSVRIFTRKAYHSVDRQRPLVVDVSLELYRRGCKEAYFRWIWECKDYSRLVPVDDIEEFHAKLEQIGLHKTKGTVVCRRGFQKGALVYAESKGIGLAILSRNAQLERVLEAPPGDLTDYIESILTGRSLGTCCSIFHGISSAMQPAVSLKDLLLLEIGSELDDSPIH